METNGLGLQRMTRVAGLALAIWLGTMQPGLAQTPAVEPRADELLHSMSHYLGKPETFSAQAESTQEVLRQRLLQGRFPGEQSGVCRCQ